MLDPQGKASINEQIQKLHDERNITILSITHDMEEVAQSEICNSIKRWESGNAGDTKTNL